VGLDRSPHANPRKPYRRGGQGDREVSPGEQLNLARSLFGIIKDVYTVPTWQSFSADRSSPSVSELLPSIFPFLANAGDSVGEVDVIAAIRSALQKSNSPPSAWRSTSSAEQAR
jgi:hypothetical protein